MHLLNNWGQVNNCTIHRHCDDNNVQVALSICLTCHQINYSVGSVHIIQVKFLFPLSPSPNNMK